MNDIQERFNQVKSKMTVNHPKLSDQQIPITAIEMAIKIAGSAPSGANLQPWTYVLISDNILKQKLADRLGNETLIDSPYIIVLFKQNHGIKINEDGTKGIVKHYYAHESACLSGGMLLGAFHYANINYELLPVKKQINDVLLRPSNEKAILALSIAMTDNSEEMMRKLIDYYEIVKERRSIRRYRNQIFDQEIISESIELVDSLLSSPYYHFECISDSVIKQKIRDKAEEKEKRLYKELISEEWKNALKPMRTNWQKAHLTEAPYLIIVFSRRKLNQQIIDSKTMTGIATGLLIQILHYIGLSTLTYTPSPMKFINDILVIPTSLTPLMVLPVGYRDINYQLPDIKRKVLQEILIKLI